MEPCEFNNHFLLVFSEKLCKENMVVVLEDFNVDLLKYYFDEEVADAMYSRLLIPNTSSPTQIRSTLHV